MTPKRNNNNDDDQQQQHLLLAWSDRQRRILTANGKADEYYTADRGFPFADTELPHHYLLQGDTHTVFRNWKQKRITAVASSSSSSGIAEPGASVGAAIVVGAWKRRYFVGGWEFSTDQQEDCYNLQTHSLFIDLRLPTCRFKRHGVRGVEDLSPHELRLYARQHIFAGFTLQSDIDPSSTRTGVTGTAHKFPLVCTRHHCIDWNFTGTPRNRPNKWWVEPNPCFKTNHSWKEWAYATDMHGQHYYCEMWEHLEDEQYKGGNCDNDRPIIALRRKANDDRDGVLVIVGDHFSYCLGRAKATEEVCSSLVEAVDAAVEKGELNSARRWLSIEGGHGRISTGWKIDAATNYWLEGTSLWKKEQIDVVPEGNQLVVVWNGHPWEVFESNVENADGLKALLTLNL